MEFYVLIKGRELWGIHVKEAEFFKEQGGLTEDWGRDWVPITANNSGEARSWGVEQHKIGRIDRRAAVEAQKAKND